MAVRTYWWLFKVPHHHVLLSTVMVSFNQPAFTMQMAGPPVRSAAVTETHLKAPPLWVGVVIILPNNVFYCWASLYVEITWHKIVFFVCLFASNYPKQLQMIDKYFDYPRLQLYCKVNNGPTKEPMRRISGIKLLKIFGSFYLLRGLQSHVHIHC